MLLVAPRILVAQERGAIALGELVDGLGVTARVLMIGAHPDDEDTFMITWLSRGRHVETAYLSLTRGDGGQNLIGNELGEALGVIRTEELRAARRIDGARQFFTRAYDFGFSKDTIDTFRHWDREAILGDVVRAIRTFRPDVIIPVFSGTPRDGHGHHQASGLLAREAFRLAADVVRFPRASFGDPWTPLKLYGNARYDPAGGETMQIDVGEYSPLLGRSYGEIAADSRSQHKSQGFGTPIRKGPVLDALRREMTRVNESTLPNQERSIFDGIDTSLARYREVMPDAKQRAMLDSLPAAIAAAKAAFDPRAPWRMLPTLQRVNYLMKVERSNEPRDYDARVVFGRIAGQVQRAMQLAAGIESDAIARREVWPVGELRRVVVTTYNRGHDTVLVSRAYNPNSEENPPETSRVLPPTGVATDTIEFPLPGLRQEIMQPHWLMRPRVGDMFQPEYFGDETDRYFNQFGAVIVDVSLRRPWAGFGMVVPVEVRDIDAVKGEIRRPVAAVPAVSVTLEQQVQYAPANAEFLRDLTVTVRSADEKPRDVRVALTLPGGLQADSASRTARLVGYGAAQTLTFRLRGRLAAGTHVVAATATSNGETFANGYQLVDYDHIRRQRIYRPARTSISAVELRVPAALRVAYVTGVGDNVAPTLAQLGIPVTLIPAAEVTRADLTPYTTVVIGPRAYEAHSELAAANPHLLDFARRGGSVVVQYGQYEMTQPGAMPYPITLNRPADRVTDEGAAVTIESPEDKLLRAPNRIDAKDFAGWVQERALYMPRTFDSRYRSLLSMQDPGEPPQKGAILVAPIGEGQYVYTTLSLFRQLPAGVPGAARLFVNLLSAGIPTTSLNP